MRTRNRAKCRLCNDIIESKHQYDFVTCSCGEVSIEGGKGNGHFRASFKNQENFVCVDDEGNEIVPKYTEGKPIEPPKPIELPKRDELIAMLDEMIKRFDSLPVDALYAPITHADHYQLMLLLSSIFKAKE